jgi:tape measure domain-containing protein
MASNATSLNVRLGLIFDEKTLAQVERQLRRSGEKLQRVGQDLTLSLSAPLALFGGAAIKAAGDLESLTLALQSQVGTADKAAAELEKLTKVAESPGLGLEQVVKASVSLQAVGIEADRARTIITALGKANASVAGSAEQFGAVTRQFTQMIAKGKVYQEDLMVIQENLPNISQLMKQAFGAATADDLNRLGIDANEFVDGITRVANELPAVKSGIKNNIENALDATRIALGKVGAAIVTSFDISGKLEAFAKFIGDVAKEFDQLSATTKTAIVSFGAFLIALGPIATTIGNVRIVSSFLIDNWKGLVGASKDVIKWVQLQRTAFLALNTATQAFVGIGIVVAIATLAYNMGAFNRELSAAEKGMKIVNDLTAQATSDTAGERAQVEALINILKSETESREKKIEALNQLKQINPEYFGQLNVEKLTVDSLNKSYEAYVDGIIKAARAKKAEGELIKLDEQQQLALKRVADAEKAVQRQIESRSQAQTFASATNQINADQALIDAKNQLDGINKQIEAVKGLIKENVKLEVTTRAATNATAKSVQVGASSATTIKKQTKEQKDLNDELEKTAVIQSKPIPNFAQLPTLPTPTSVTQETPVLPNIAGATVQAGNIYQSFAERLGAINMQMKEGVMSFGDAFSQTFSAVMESGSGVEKTFFAISESLVQTAADGSSSLKAFATAAVGAAAKIIRAQIQEAVAGSITTALARSGIPFPFNIAAGAAAGAAASGLFNKLLSAVKVPGFARGTQYAPGGMALVGEQGPELINLPRGSTVTSNNRTNQLLDSMGGGGTLQGEFTVRGTDLVLVLDRATKKSNRAY